jgi:hypothetical protein
VECVVVAVGTGKDQNAEFHAISVSVSLLQGHPCLCEIRVAATDSANAQER